MNLNQIIELVQKPPYMWILVGIGAIIVLSIISSIWRSILNAIDRANRQTVKLEADPVEFQKLREYTIMLASSKFESFLLSVQEKDEAMLLVTKCIPENQRHLGYKLLKAAQHVVEDNSDIAKIELDRAATAMQMYLDAAEVSNRA